MERTIIHLNVADFAAAVERNLCPSLKGKALVIAPAGAARAVVYDMSEEAYQEGVRKGMPLGKALRLSRKATVLPPCFHRYERAMKAMIKRTFAYSPRVESGSADGHLFVDATGTSRLFGPPVDVAWRLNREMKKDFSLDPVWSVAPNKLTAKVGTRLAKPTGEYIVGPGEEEAFLSPLDLDLIPGLEPADLARFREFNFVKVFQVRALELSQLEVVFSARALAIYETVRGIDTRVIPPAAAIGSDFQADHEFADDTNQAADLKQALFCLVERICRRLRSRHLAGAAMDLAVSYSDGRRQTASLSMDPATSSAMPMFRQCIPLLYRAWARRTRIRHMRLACIRTASPRAQLDLFDRSTQRQDSLAAALDAIHDRFGSDAVVQGLKHRA